MSIKQEYASVENGWMLSLFLYVICRVQLFILFFVALEDAIIRVVVHWILLLHLMPWLHTAVSLVHHLDTALLARLIFELKLRLAR